MPLEAAQISFGDTTASTGWADLGLITFNAAPQTVTFTDTISSSAGNIVFALTINSDGNLKSDNSDLKVSGGAGDNRIDSNDWADTGDDEYISFTLDVYGGGVADLTALSLDSLTLTFADTDDSIEFADADSNANTLSNPGDGPHSYSDGINTPMDGLTPLSLQNVGTLGDGSWELKLTARAHGDAQNQLTTLFRIDNLTLNYTVDDNFTPLTLPTAGLALHLDAGTITDTPDGTALANGWADLSGNGFDATTGTMPTYLADGGGGYPAVSFNGIDQYLESPLPTDSTATVFTVYRNMRTPLLAGYSDTLLSTSDATTRIHLASTRKTEHMPLIQFGWEEELLFNTDYRNQLGEVDEIIDWSGNDSVGQTDNQNGSLAGAPAGSSLSSYRYGVTLNSQAITVAGAATPLTLRSGTQLGVDAVGGSASFRESDACSWSFDFDRDVEVQNILFSGVNATADAVEITIQGGDTYNLVRDDMADTSVWSASTALMLYTFPAPVSLPAGNDITITATGSSNPSSNQFSIGAILVKLYPEAPDYPGFVAEEVPGGSVVTSVNGKRKDDAGTDTLPNRYYIGSATYTNLPAATSLTIGARNSNDGEYGQNDIREVLVYDYDLSDAEHNQVVRYLGEKYGIDVDWRSLDSEVAEYNHILGTQQIGIHYSFGESGARVLDAARMAYRHGSRTFKLAVSRNYGSQNGVNQDPDITSLKEVVQKQPDIKEVFDMPFKDVLFWAITFANPKFGDGVMGNGEWWNGADDIQRGGTGNEDKEYDEIYELTEYLLQTYSGTGKRFYIGNWEGDWMLNGSNTWPDPNTIPSERITAMADWATIRQQAVNDAKAATPHNDVEVWYYLEMNRADWVLSGEPCIVNSVMPILSSNGVIIDYISFSSYTLKFVDESTSHQAMDLIHDSLLPHPSITEPRLIIGEYGYQLNALTFEQQTDLNREKAQQYLNWANGPPKFILIWQMFHYEENDQGTPIKFLNHIDVDGSVRPNYYLHENYLREMRQWVDRYYSNHGTLPSRAAYAAHASSVLGRTALTSYEPDLSNPLPYSVLIDGYTSNKLHKLTADTNFTSDFLATIFSPYGQILQSETIDWSVTPDSQGVTIDNAGTLTVDSTTAVADSYTVTASVDGLPAVTSSLLQDLSATPTLYDPLDDLTMTYSYDANITISTGNAELNFEGDVSRAARSGSSAGSDSIIWELSHLNDFLLRLYHFGGIADRYTVEVSPDATNWETVPCSSSTPFVTNGDWKRSWIYPAYPLPAGSRYIRVTLMHPTQPWNPQLSEVYLYGGFESWVSSNYPSYDDQVNASISGAEADPNATGISNFMRYVLDLDSGTTQLPPLMTVDSSQGFNAAYDPSKSDVEWKIEGSLDLLSWPYTLFDSTVDTATPAQGYIPVDASSMPANDTQYYRLNITLPAQ